jgi:hypothetical protein
MMNITEPKNGVEAAHRIPSGRILRIRFGLVASIVGLLVFLLGAEPGLFTLDRSPVTGFVQIAVFLVGLGIICLGGFISLNTLWNGTPKTIIYDIGLRLVATGYVIAVASGMADIFGFGSQTLPAVPRFGTWQKVGVISGQFVIAVGFLMMILYPRWIRFLGLKGIRRMKYASGQMKNTSARIKARR